MKTIKLLLVLVLTFGLAFATSLLLDVPWVARQWPRQTLVGIIMALELLVGLLVFLEILKDTPNA